MIILNDNLKLTNIFCYCKELNIKFQKLGKYGLYGLYPDKRLVYILPKQICRICECKNKK